MVSHSQAEDAAHLHQRFTQIFGHPPLHDVFAMSRDQRAEQARFLDTLEADLTSLERQVV